MLNIALGSGSQKILFPFCSTINNPPANPPRITTYSTPTLPLPLQFGQVTRPNLSARVNGAFGLARKGSFLGTLPVPLQSGHIASIIPLACAFRLFLLASIISFQGVCPFVLFKYTPLTPPKTTAPTTVARAQNRAASYQKPWGKSIIR